MHIMCDRIINLIQYHVFRRDNVNIREIIPNVKPVTIKETTLINFSYVDITSLLMYK